MSPSEGGDHMETMQTSQTTHPVTIEFELNAMPEVDYEEQGYVQDMCDLPLNLIVPTAPGKGLHPTTTVVAPSRDGHDGDLASKNTEKSGEEGSSVGQSHVSCPTALMVGGSSNVEGDVPVEASHGKAQTTRSYGARLTKRI